MWLKIKNYETAGITNQWPLNANRYNFFRYIIGLWNGPRLQDQGKGVLANQESCSVLRLLQVRLMANQESYSVLRPLYR